MSQTDKPTEHALCAACGAAPSMDRDDDEPTTHCEWCGAEYPLPHHANATGEGADSRAPEERDS